jgi:hypothetical protein
MLIFKVFNLDEAETGLVFMVVVLALALFAVIVFRTWRDRRKSSKTLIVDETKDEEAVAETVINPDDYVVDEDDKNLFHNLMNNDFSIRIRKSVQYKDQLIFDLSLPHEYEIDRESMKALIPQLMVIASTDSHSLLVSKSPAAKFSDLQDQILRFLFSYLHDSYGWETEKQLVLISSSYGSDVVVFNLRTKTNHHFKLAEKLIALPGIIKEDEEDVMLGLCQKGVYEFKLKKAKAFSWEELLPKIEAVFIEYFKAGVKFKNTVINDVTFLRD